MKIIEELINDKFGLSSDSWIWEEIQSDGSSRQFFRFQNNQQSVIAVVTHLKQLRTINENDSYFYIGKHLRRKGLPVPEIFTYARKPGIIIMEDLGETHLQNTVDFDKRPRESYLQYEKLLQILLKMQIDGAEDFDTRRCFDTSSYDARFIFERELEYFRKEFLNRFLGKKTSKNILKIEFEKLSTSVASIPSNYFMHRDFQSRNLMVKENEVFIIDFQGGRSGPPTYDLASLLIDPYVQVPVKYQESLLETYHLDIKNTLDYSLEEFYDAFWKTALCRNLQILAAFAYLNTVKKKPFFKDYITPALGQLDITLDHIPTNDYPLLKNLLSESFSECKN